MTTERATYATPLVERARRFGPWPWYLSAADFVGLDLDLVDEIAGDLTEACAEHSAQGRTLARAWCFAEIVRSLPHLALNTLRRGERRARLRLIAVLGSLVFVATAGVAAVEMRVGPPARIAADRGFDANAIVINNVEYVQMPVRVVDARGHTVTAAAVHYAWVGGDRIDISPNGAVACHERADATLRASFADLVSAVTVHCRPITQIQTTSWIDFLQGDPPRALPFEAIGADGKVATELRGSMRVANSKVATMDRGILTPHGIGASGLTISIGDARVRVPVIVHQLVQRFDNLTPTQLHVAMPLRIALGDTLHLPVPAGTVWVKWLPRGGAVTPPSITAEGPGYCHVGGEPLEHWLPKNEFGAYCYVSAGARIRIARSTVGEPLITGALLLERMSQ